MTEEGAAAVVRLEAARSALRDHFLGWQCRLRQMAVRDGGGRPTSGMRPTLVLPGREAVDVTVLIVQRAPEEATAQFRHLIRQTQDPAERYKNALKHLAAAYYQYPRDFSDELTALFGPRSALAEGMLAHGHCTLRFEQYNQRYILPCVVRAMTENEPAYQATYWHNSLFNPNIPADSRVLGLQPDWAEAEADPPAKI